jgi:formate/nitrite transporter FocA (FNT family)
MARTGTVPADFDASVITMTGIIHNLVPVTLGNIVGGAGLVGAVYWMIYRVAFGASSGNSSTQGKRGS